MWEERQLEFLVVMVIFAVLVLLFLPGSIYRVDQQSVAIIERNGRFLHTSQPGLHFKVSTAWPGESRYDNATSMSCWTP